MSEAQQVFYHLGVALAIFGVTMTTSYGIATDNALAPGESMDIAGYRPSMWSTSGFSIIDRN